MAVALHILAELLGSEDNLLEIMVYLLLIQAEDAHESINERNRSSVVDRELKSDQNLLFEFDYVSLGDELLLAGGKESNHAIERRRDGLLQFGGN